MLRSAVTTTTPSPKVSRPPTPTSGMFDTSVRPGALYPSVDAFKLHVLIPMNDSLNRRAKLMANGSKYYKRYGCASADWGKRYKTAVAKLAKNPESSTSKVTAFLAKTLPYRDVVCSYDHIINMNKKHLRNDREPSFGKRLQSC